MRKEPRFFDGLLIVTFVICLFLPLLLTHNRDVSSIEQRKLAPLPKLGSERRAFAAYPAKFEAFFNDHFGFRDRLAQLYTLFCTVLKSSPSSAVLIGRDGWLFYNVTNAGNNLTEDFRRSEPLSADQLQQWKTVLETKDAWLKRQGIQYLFVIVPEKQSIYGEYIPSRIRQVGKQSRIDQLLDYMRDSDVAILDLRPALMKAKAVGLVYIQTDSHWNALGASVAQYEIMAYLSKHFPSLRPISYRVEEFSWSSYAGDLARILNLSSRLTASAPQLREPIRGPAKHPLKENGISEGMAPFFTEGPAGGPRALIFRDSFLDALQPYLSQYFSKALYAKLWLWPDIDQLEDYLKRKPADAPDVVIEEHAERSLRDVPPAPTAGSLARYAFPERVFDKGVVVYRLAERRQDELAERHQILVTASQHGYTLESLGRDPHFVLPEINADAGTQYIVKMVLSTPVRTRWQIFYPASEGYAEQHSVTGLLQPGENTVYAVMDGRDLQGRLRIDPGTEIGKYVLDLVEIRVAKGG